MNIHHLVVDISPLSGYYSAMHSRKMTSELSEAMSDTPVALVHGARQTGKSTLVQSYASTASIPYVTLDDASQLAAARSDPQGYLAGLASPVVIDEVQRAPTLFPAIKLAVDKDRQPGKYLLTGSANIMLLPKISESLAGRMQILRLWPFSQGEVHDLPENFPDAVFSLDLPKLQKPAIEIDLASAVLQGAFPEVVNRASIKRRSAWYESYLTALLQRDIRDLANIEGLDELPKLLALLAARSSSLLNLSEVSRSAGIANSTLKRYMSLLRATFLYEPLPAWSANIGKRLVKSPKIHLTDSGLAAHLSGLAHANTNPAMYGKLLESFVFTELRKQLGWSNIRANLYHFRTTSGREVDLLMEDAGGRLVGMEVKAAASVSRKDFAGLEALRESIPDKFHRGIVLYSGVEEVSFSSDLIALPVSALWRYAASAETD